jgi:uncharacterized UPF0160 family protein
MSIFNKKKICVTHDGTFHTDDLFATATLSLLNNGNITIVRTRNNFKIKKGDYVYDVGGEYNADEDIFDHHQREGAGVRVNGIPYSAFGLVWDKYGEKICGSREVADMIDKKIVCPIDAVDNGFDISKQIYEGVFPYYADQVFLNYLPTWKEDNKNIDKIFEEQVGYVCKLLQREIKVAKDNVEAKEIIMNAYENTEDKRIIILENDFPRYLFQSILSLLPEPLYLVYPSSHSSTWKVESINISPDTMESRKLLPISWRGFMNNDERLRKITGVPDTMFCHRYGFLITVLSKEGAIKLAEKALLA